MASGLVRASLACAAAAALLTTSTSGYAAWQTAAESSGPAAAALESGATRVFITSPGGEPREVDAQAGVRVTVGDTVSVRMPVTIRTGADPLAVLKVAVPTASGDAAQTGSRLYIDDPWPPLWLIWAKIGVRWRCTASVMRR